MGATSVQDRLRELHFKAYEANERRIRALVSAPRRFERSDLDTYERELIESIPDEWTPAAPAELRARIRKARVILVGDYHTLRQSQRGFLRVLRAIRSRRLVIALEFVMARYQRHVDAYLAGRLDETAFLRRIEYHRSWPSYQVWPNFKPIFDHARLHGLPVVALDCEPAECQTVFSRAAFASWRIAEALRDHPHARVAVLMGEAHLAPSHLPAQLRQALDRIGLPAPILTIHQTLDPLYFELVRRGLENRVDVVRLTEDRYYVPVSTPLAAQHSFLAAVSDEPWTARPEDSQALRREFARSVRTLARLLGLPVSRRLRTVRVFGPGCIEGLSSALSGLPADLDVAVQAQVRDGESVCLPEHDFVCLAEPTPTHIAEEAAHFLKATTAGGPVPEDPNDFFYSRVLHEAIGYFGSKTANPKRKPPSAAAIRDRAAQALDSERKDLAFSEFVAAMLALWHRRAASRRTFARDSLDRYVRDSGFAAGLGDLGPEVIRPLVHLIGYELGERLYTAFDDRSLSVREIRRLFRTDFEAPGAAFPTYHHLARRLRSITLAPRF